MSRAVAEALQGVLPLARRIATSPTAEVSTTTRSGVTTVTVTDGTATLLRVTLDARPRVEPPRGEQLAMFTESGAPARHTRTPAPEPAPMALVHLQVRESFQQEHLWRPTPGALAPLGPKGPFVAWSRADYHWLRTVVARELADAILAISPGAFEETPAGARADHTVRVGATVPAARDMNAVRGAPARVLAVAPIDLTRVCDTGPVLCAIVELDDAPRAAVLAEARYLDHADEGFYLVAQYPATQGENGEWLCPLPEEPAKAKRFKPKAKKPAPEPSADDTVRIRGLAVGDRITLDEDEIEVMGVDEQGFVWRTADDGRDRDEGDCEWSDVEEVSPRVYRIRPVETETPAKQRAARRSRKAPPKSAAHAARRDDLDMIAHASWASLVISAGGSATMTERPDGLTDAAWRAQVRALVAGATELGHARLYSARRRCIWDSRDGGLS